VSIMIGHEVYYRTSETARLAGISRSTLLRWLNKGVIKDTSRRDRRGWRLFAKADIERIQREAHRIK
jgi:DNA-binding transcriptional MerR regulator